MQPEVGVYANVELVVDTTNTDDIDTAISLFVDSSTSENWDVQAEGIFQELLYLL